MSSFTASPRKPRLLIAIICTLGVGDRQHEASGAVEEAKLEQVDAQECADAVRRAAERRNLAIRDRELLGAERGVLIDAADRILQPRDWIMQQGLFEPPYRPVTHDALVHQVIGE